MIVPRLSGDALLADIQADRHEPGSFRLWWLGQSGFLVQWQNRHLLLDPYLSNSLTKKYADTDKPHVRLSQRVIEPVRLDFVDLVTSSHNHTDHLDAETLAALREANPRLTILVPAANREFAAARLGVAPERLAAIDANQSAQLAGFTVHAVPAAHETVELDELGRCRFLGYVIQFGPWTIYHSGDTVLYEGLADRLAQWKIDVALLPINGSLHQRRVAGNLWGRESARLAHEVQARCVIPCHYDMFEFNTVTPREFVDACKQLDQPFRVLELGERFCGDAVIGDRD